MAKNLPTGAFVKHKIKRKGIHAKSKMSKLKSSKNYVKRYNSQGRI
jgi:hypothetical protein